jgi:hypothetical protein
MNVNKQINIYHDHLVLETLFGKNLSKYAQDTGMFGGMLDKVKTYFSNNVNPDNKAGSLLSMLAPIAITQTLRMLGVGPILSFLAGLAERVFHVEIDSIFASIYNGLKSELSGGKSTTSDKVDNIVQSAVQEHSPVADTAQSNDFNQVRKAQLIRLIFDSKNKELYKLAAPASTSLLSRMLSILFRVIVGSAGLMVAGDAINHYLDRPNALDNTIQKGKPVNEVAAVPQQQIPFQLNPSYQDVQRNSGSDSWIEDITNNASSISQMLLGFAKDVYQGLDDKENAIQSNPYFNNLVETISWYNHESPNSSTIFIPQMFKSKKQLVDQFMAHVAKT